MICKCRKEVSQSEQYRRKQRYYARPKSITEVSEGRHGQVHAQFGRNRDDVNLKLCVMELRLEQMAVYRVCRDAAGAEAVDNSPNEAQPSYELSLDPLPVAFHDAFGDLLEEAAGVAGVLALS